eukprot:jgi/Psemu1/236854/estExt_Genewise1.C_570035
MSASLPFLKRPEMLDGTLPGDRGFDPFNFASDPAALTWYRDSEIKHARLAMLAAVGWPLAELSHKSLASTFDLQPILGVEDKVPSNGENREPGDFGFDPFSLAGSSNEQKFFMREAEIFNGRLAMLAITGFVAQEFSLNMGVVNQTPIFFKPFSDVVAQFLGSSGISV